MGIRVSLNFFRLHVRPGRLRGTGTKEKNQGTLNGTQTAITSGTFEQQWELDATGNWKTFKQVNDGNGTWELNQTRTANKANEITGISNSTGTAWATPTYDGAGNMIGMPNPPATTTGATPAWVPLTEAQWNTLTEAQWSAMTENTGTTPQELSARYDAWNRLVLITNGTQKVSEHVYDARGYRIRKDAYASGTLTEARHYYYTPGWQCVEERVDAGTTAERQFIWGLRYIDDLVMRDRSTANNGTINERRYAMQDGNWNTIAICDITGSVGERFAYSAYGSPVFMNGSGTVQSASAIGFETLYAGYRWDGATPQMYYVRNRFLMPVIGTWNRRDPLGYVDGMALYCVSTTISNTDPYGDFPPDEVIDRRNPRVTVEGRKPSSKEIQIRNGSLQYSCRCGWIDWGHAGGFGKNPSQGLEEFRKVWEQVKAIGSSKERGGRRTVCYETSQSKGILTTGVRMCFYVHSGLSDNEIRCAAWGIFRKVQETFEKHQANMPILNSSGQSPKIFRRT